jgi:hypothetical protein
MAKRSPLLRIHDMLESIRGIEKALAGKTMRDYERSWLLRSGSSAASRLFPKPAAISAATSKHNTRMYAEGYRRNRQHLAA